jgi:HAD superfamily phosphatase (TIGR01668 family)
MPKHIVYFKKICYNDSKYLVREANDIAVFSPEYYFDAVTDIPASLFTQLGIQAVVLDIDNTLVTYDDPKPTPSAAKFLKMLTDLGISVAFLSNNGPERVTEFNRELGFPFLYKGHKPLTGKMKKLMQTMNVTPDNTMMIGDQIFTDICCGNFAGTHTILVKPIKDKLTPFFRCKRFLEKPILRRFKRRHPERCFIT